MNFYFYDLETSGISARAQRVMQFAGQRTTQQLEPVGQPDSFLVRLGDEVLPDPEAILLTGITPQQTHNEGYSEPEFLQGFLETVEASDTVVVGFNNIRFDDEFIRHSLWRNFYDPYQWQYQHGASRWDLLDVSRMVRALRPEGISWPLIDEQGKLTTDKAAGRATNKLELLTEANNIPHLGAHDALADVRATIAVAQLLKTKQPKLFDYLFGLRRKEAVKAIVNQRQQPYLYTSGRYSSVWHKTTAVMTIGALQSAVLVYDLRQSPGDLAALSDAQLADKAFRRDESEILAVKSLRLNACPAVAPIGVVAEAAVAKRLNLSTEMIEHHRQQLLAQPALVQRLNKLFEVSRARFQTSKNQDADFGLYEGFVAATDSARFNQVRQEQKLPEDLFDDPRLNQLAVRYQARYNPKLLTDQQRQDWERYRAQRIMKGLPGQLSITDFMKRLADLAELGADQFIIEELRLYAESICPTEMSEVEAGS